MCVRDKCDKFFFADAVAQIIKTCKRCKIAFFVQRVYVQFLVCKKRRKIKMIIKKAGDSPFTNKYKFLIESAVSVDGSFV